MSYTYREIYKEALEEDMSLDHESCYKALESRDSRFDGAFFTAVKTTGIYCRPICSARTPKTENCTFYKWAAQAENAGYRPCLKCRPELAPGFADTEQYSLLLMQAVEQMETLPQNLQEVADYLGITTRHLQRIFQEGLGLSPHQYLQTKKLLVAKQFLTDTHLSLQQVSDAAGFGSLSSFNRLFKTHYQLAPSALRKEITPQHSTHQNFTPQHSNPVKVQIGYRPPLNWERLLSFFEQRAIPSVEWVSASQGIYRRTIAFPVEGWLEVTAIDKKHGHALQLTVSDSLTPYLQLITNQVRQTFDLSLVSELLPNGIPQDTRLPGCFDTFEMAIRAILGQQITVKAARTLAHRITQTLGKPLQNTISPWPELTHTFPRPDAFTDPEVLTSLGVLNTRSHTIIQLADAVRANQLQLNRGANKESLRKQLLALKGIGPWTADYILMRSTGWPNVFLRDDIGVLHGLASALDLPRKSLKSAMNLIETEYAPWLSYLVISIWQQTWQPSPEQIKRLKEAIYD